MNTNFILTVYRGFRLHASGFGCAGPQTMFRRTLSRGAKPRKTSRHHDRRERLTEKDLELIELVKTPSAATLKEARKTVERERIQYTLKKHLGGISSTAAELGISRPTLYELMKKLGGKNEILAQPPTKQD